MRRAFALVAALAVAALIVVPAALAHSRHSDHNRHHSHGAISYAVIGDTPYGSAQFENFPDDVAEINEDRSVRLVMHLGDIKSGSTECSTSYFEAIRAAFDQFKAPMVYTPGDNEWTDCHRANNGAYWPAGPALNGDTRPARLDEIHRVFFDRPGWTLGQHPRRVSTQGGNYAENVLWSQADVQFGDLHVIGSNNDWAPWFGEPRTTSQIDEVEGRMQANLAWIDRIFDRAHRTRAKAVAIGMQADMWDPGFGGDPSNFDHFQPIVRALADHARHFRGPVLLLNGDSHAFVDDRPLADPANPQNKAMYGITADVPNLRRITVNGSSTPCHEWLKLTVNPRSREVFSYQRMQFANQPGLDHTVCPER